MRSTAGFGVRGIAGCSYATYRAATVLTKTVVKIQRFPVARYAPLDGWITAKQHIAFADSSPGNTYAVQRLAEGIRARESEGQVNAHHRFKRPPKAGCVDAFEVTFAGLSQQV